MSAEPQGTTDDNPAPPPDKRQVYRGTSDNPAPVTHAALNGLAQRLEGRMDRIERESESMQIRLGEGSRWMHDLGQNMSGLRSSITDWLATFSGQFTAFQEAIAAMKASNYQMRIVIGFIAILVLLDVAVRLVQLSKM